MNLVALVLQNLLIMIRFFSGQFGIDDVDQTVKMTDNLTSDSGTNLSHAISDVFL